MNAAERAACLEWPDRRLCDWECPWPGYCVDCHNTAWLAMVDAQQRLLSVACSVPLEDVREQTRKLLR